MVSSQLFPLTVTYVILRLPGNYQGTGTGKQSGYYTLLNKLLPIETSTFNCYVTQIMLHGVSCHYIAANIA